MNTRKPITTAGFSLVELLVVISIVATMVTIALPNYLGARQRARDAKRKSELQQLKTALQLYQNDYGSFPDGSSDADMDEIHGCGASGDEPCPKEGCSVDFGAGTDTCDTVYMSKFPDDFPLTVRYYPQGSGSDFCLTVPLENISDSDITAARARCAAKCSGATMGDTEYPVCSE